MLLAAMLLLTLAAGAWMTRPLWRGALDTVQRRRAANVSAYRLRVAEIDADRDAGLTDAETADALRAELDARLLAEAGSGDAGAATAGARSPWMALSLVLLVLLLAWAGYVASGSWRVQQQIAGGGAGETDQGERAQAIAQLAGELEARVQQQPQDVESWVMLGRARFGLERYEASAQAYAKANELTGQREPDLLVNQAEALGMARDRNLRGEPQQLLEAALAIRPQHMKGLWYAGLAAEQAGDPALAHRHWRTLAGMPVPDPLREALAERLRATGDDSELAAAADATAAAQPADADADGGVVLNVAVRLDPALAGKLPPDTTLFVFARAASGPPMPLAVYRGAASELPRTVRLDDSMAMMPSMKLSAFPRWQITARLSRSGQPQGGSGDLEGSLTVARQDLGTSALEVVIDTVVP